MQPEDVDLNALRALHQLLESRSVTRAARNLGTTQPNLSRTLARLRGVFGDPLFVSSGRVLEPTPFALSLAPEVQRALSATRAVFEAAARRHESGDALPLRLAASDYVSVVVLRPWLTRAPGSYPVDSLRIVNPGLQTIGALQQGEVDLALVPPAAVAALADFVVRPLCDDEFVLVMRHGHPLSRGKPTTERYLASDHVIVENDVPGLSAVHEALLRMGHVRRVRARVPTQLTALAMVAGSDLVASLPARLVRASGLSLVARPLPFPVERLVINLVYHPRWASDAYHRRLRESLLSVVPEPP